MRGVLLAAATKTGVDFPLLLGFLIVLALLSIGAVIALTLREHRDRQ